MAKATDVRTEIIELAERYGWEIVTMEMIQRMSGEDARDFLEHFENSYLEN